MPADITCTDLTWRGRALARLRGRHGNHRRRPRGRRPPASPPPTRRSLHGAAPPRAILTPCYRPGPYAQTSSCRCVRRRRLRLFLARRVPAAIAALRLVPMGPGLARRGQEVNLQGEFALLRHSQEPGCAVERWLRRRLRRAPCSISPSRTRRRRLPPRSTSTPPRTPPRRRDVGAAIRDALAARAAAGRRRPQCTAPAVRGGTLTVRSTSATPARRPRPSSTRATLRLLRGRA